MNNGFEQANGSFETATTESTAVATINGFSDDGLHFVVDLTERQVSYCSMKPTTEEESAVLFNAMNNPEKRIKDCINMDINVKDVFVEVVYPVNEKTGLASACPRIVLIDREGVGYQAVSLGMYGAIKKIFTSFGTPDTWKAPKTFRVKQISKGEKSLLTLDAVLPKVKK